MQPQFGSVSLVADAYERELRADARRVRGGTPDLTIGPALPRSTPRWQRWVGARLVRAGQRLQGIPLPGTFGLGGVSTVATGPDARAAHGDGM